MRIHVNVAHIHMHLLIHSYVSYVFSCWICTSYSELGVCGPLSETKPLRHSGLKLIRAKQILSATLLTFCFLPAGVGSKTIRNHR